MIKNKNRILKTSKGYRLKDSTHRMIEKIQLIINGSKDTVISRAVKMYHTEINKTCKVVVKGNKNLHTKISHLHKYK